LGQPPDGDFWIISKRKKGAHLNTSVEWTTLKDIKRQGGKEDVYHEYGFQMDQFAADDGGNDAPRRRRRDDRE
jgi:hypothetical protein